MLERQHWVDLGTESFQLQKQQESRFGSSSSSWGLRKISVASAGTVVDAGAEATLEVWLAVAAVEVRDDGSMPVLAIVVVILEWQ